MRNLLEQLFWRTSTKGWFWNVFMKTMMKLRKNKNCSSGLFNFILKEQVKMFVFISWKKQVKMLVFILWLSFFGVCIQMQYFCDVVRNKLWTISIWVQEKNMSCERALNFDQWNTFSENYQPMRVWLWLVYKFTENYCHLRLFSEFIQTQKRYPTSLDKIHNLTW